MRVLHVSPYFAPAFIYGGPPRSVLGLCRALRDAGADVSVVTTTANGEAELPPDLSWEARYEGVPVAYLPRSFPKRAFRAAVLGPLLAERLRAGLDLVHIHGCWNAFGWTAARECRRAGVPFVLSPRGMLYPWSFARGRVRKWVSYHAFEQRSLQAAAFIHATSRAEAEVVDALGVGSRVVTIPNGIEDETRQVGARAADFRRRYGIAPDAVVVLFLGRLHPKKGIELLIDGFRAATDARPSARLVVAGPGDPAYVAQLESRCGDLLRTRRVVFTGHLTGQDRTLALASADAFALTSYSENFGLGIGEAMAAGLPVVVSRACPWPTIEEWRAGWWIDATVPAVTSALTALLADPAAARAMGARGRQHVLEMFDWTQIGRRMLTAYEAALGN